MVEVEFGKALAEDQRVGNVADGEAVICENERLQFAEPTNVSW